MGWKEIKWSNEKKNGIKIKYKVALSKVNTNYLKKKKWKEEINWLFSLRLDVKISVHSLCMAFFQNKFSHKVNLLGLLQNTLNKQKRRRKTLVNSL